MANLKVAKTRVQLDLTDEDISLLKLVKEETRADSYSATVRQLLRFYEEPLANPRAAKMLVRTVETISELSKKIPNAI